jgi:hypothetical protein
MYTTCEFLKALAGSSEANVMVTRLPVPVRMGSTERRAWALEVGR